MSNGDGDEEIHNTYAHRDSVDVTPSECSAMRLLSGDGYTERELAMMFNMGQATIHRHVSKKCKVHSVPNEVRER